MYGPDAAALPKFMIESHGGETVSLAAQREVNAKLNKVRRAFAWMGLGEDCPISVAFVREPLSFYISLFRWAVAGNQGATASWLSEGNYALSGDYVWGADFLEWAPDNAMSRTASDAPAFFRRDFFQLRHFSRRDGRFYARGRGPGRGRDEFAFGRGDYEALREVLRGYDVVAPLSHFDHVMAILQLLYGWDEPPFYHAVRPSRPNECPTCTSAETDAEVCPDMRACRERVEELAPFDHLIYNEFSQRFLAQLAFLGDDFEAYVRAYRRELDERRRLAARGSFTPARGWWLRDDRKASVNSTGFATVCRFVRPPRLRGGSGGGYDCLRDLEERMEAGGALGVPIPVARASARRGPEE